MEIIFSDEFQAEFKRIKDKATLLRLIKHIRKLSELPESGKPLQHNLKNHRSVRMPPFRIIYRIEGETVIIVSFDNRDVAYE